MPLLILLGAAAALPLVGVAVENFTEKAPSPVGGTANGGDSVSTAIKWALLIGGTIVVVKYGTKLVNKL